MTAARDDGQGPPPAAGGQAADPARAMDGARAACRSGPGARAVRLSEQVHRMWAIAATAKACHDVGPASVTLAVVAGRSGLEEATVRRLFGDREGCLEATFERTVALAAEAAIPPSPRRWAPSSACARAPRRCSTSASGSRRWRGCW